MLNVLADEGMRIAKDYVFINLQKNYYNKSDVFDFIGKYSHEIIDIVIWGKDNPMPASGKNITNSYEFVLIMSNKHKAIKANHTYTQNLIMTPVYSSNPYEKIHRAVMSELFCKSIFRDFIHPNQTVLDPFSGMATTGIACLENDDDYTGIELVEKYATASEQRLNEAHSEIRLDLWKGEKNMQENLSISKDKQTDLQGLKNGR